MVWAGIIDNWKTDLVIVPGNLNPVGYVNILRNNLLPFLQNRGPGVILQQDNARPRTSCLSTQFLAQNGVNVLPWPALLPYQNPIEHVLDELWRRVLNNHQINNVNTLRNALLVEWQNIPNVVISRLTNSMSRRIATCIRDKGGHTRY